MIIKVLHSLEENLFRKKSSKTKVVSFKFLKIKLSFQKLFKIHGQEI